jgi:uncharacterized protein YjbI with pentapeptide repeats
MKNLSEAAVMAVLLRSIIIPLALSCESTGWAAPSAFETPTSFPRRQLKSISRDAIVQMVLEHQQALGGNFRMPRADFSDTYLRGIDWHDIAQAVSHKSGSRVAVSLAHANFNGSDLRDASFGEGHHFEASLDPKLSLAGALIAEADLTGARFANVNCTGATFDRSNLTGVRFVNSNLKGTRFIEADVTDMVLLACKVKNVLYEPKIGTIPNLYAAASVVEGLRYWNSPIGLVELRNAFKTHGLREPERVLTYSIEHTRTQRDYGGLEGLFRDLFFEWPCGWGLYPEFCLRLIIVGIGAFFPAYLIAILFRSSTTRSGIWAVRLEQPVHLSRHGSRAVPIQAKFSRNRTVWQNLRNFARAARIAFYFSLLSAFRIGFREINVGAWIMRIQAREYTLRGTGWVRVISGIQSLISLYLVALWLLTYFGHPFE